MSKRGLFDHTRQLEPANRRVMSRQQEPGLGKGLEGHFHRGIGVDPLAVERRLPFVDSLPVGEKMLRRNPGGGGKDLVEGLATMVDEPGTLAERLGIEYLIEQELEVAAGEQFHGGTIRSGRWREIYPRPAPSRLTQSLGGSS